jgi:hypothetical protein
MSFFIVCFPVYSVLYLPVATILTKWHEDQVVAIPMRYHSHNDNVKALLQISINSKKSSLF